MSHDYFLKIVILYDDNIVIELGYR